MPKSDSAAQGRLLWRALLTEETIDTGTVIFAKDQLERFCDLFGPALIANALPGGLDPRLETQARLLNKLSTHRQTQALGMLLDRGHDVIAMKGFATSRLYHRDPEARVTGDLDLLAREKDMEAIVGTLMEEGYAVATELPMPPWGFVSEASFLPMTSSDGLVDIDLHIHPDCYPLSLGLTTEDVFEGSITLDIPNLEFKAPSPEHLFLIALSNAMKEKLGPQSVKSLLDCGRILAREAALDWEAVNRLSARARLKRPAELAVAVIRYLRGDTDAPPAENAIRTASFKGAARDLTTAFESGFSLPRKLAREAFLTAEPRVALRRVTDRLSGLARQGTGIPPGAEKSAVT